MIGELKEHVANKHLLPADAWAAEKARLEALAISLLKERDSSRHEALKAEARAERREQAAERGFFARNPALKGGLVGASVVLFFVVLGLALNDAVKPRSDGMQATGMVPGSGAPQPGGEPQTDPRLDALLAAVQRAPDDLDALAAAGLYLISKQGFSESRPFFQRGTLLDPFHVKTRLGRTILQAVDGDVAGAQRELERLAALYPDAYAGRLYAGMLALEENDPARALKNFEVYLSTAPAGEVPPMMRGAVQQLRQQLASGAAPPAP